MSTNEKWFSKSPEKKNIVLEKQFFLECDLKTSGSYEVVKQFLEKNKDNLPSALIFISDKTAIGGYNAINEFGMSVPDDFSIIGNDDIAESKYLTPPLTTVSPPKNDLGTSGINLLLEEIQNTGAAKSYKQVRLLPQLIIRNSTRKIS